MVREGHLQENEEEQELNLRRALHLVSAGALTGALLLGSAPTASAATIRSHQWALSFFAAEDIWKHATGKGETVAVVDTTVDASQPDLKGSLVPGKTYGDPHDSRHGTAMAALIAAHGHGPGNNDGMKGLAPGAKIMPITGPTTSTHWPGIRYAVDHGADVINLSYVGSGDGGEEKAIKYAISKDVVVVAGTGNAGGRVKNYPAAYPGVVAVGGLGRDGKLWDDSSWGSNTTLIAPAEDNVTPNLKYQSGYGYTDGTSDSTAYVSAAAALVRQAHPNLTAGQVINRLIKSAKPLPGTGKLPDEKSGYGEVRPFRAVTYNYPAGPKAGPLAQAGKKSSDSAAAPSQSSDDSSSSSPSWLYAFGPPIVPILVALAVLVVLVVVVVLVVKKSRVGGNGPGGPGGPSGPGGGVPPMPHQGQQYQQPPAGQFGGPPTSPPPPPNYGPRQ